MCFSAEASFSVSALLAAIGAITAKNVKTPHLRLVALVPFLFALQQFAEGFVWLYMNGTIENSSLGVFAQYAYLSFAWVLWPVYTPLAIFIAENIGWRKIVCILCLGLGIFVSYIGLIFLANEPLFTTVIGHSINYGISYPSENLIYGISVLIPLLISSVKGLWIFGLLLLISFIISQLIYGYAFTSVWCFFAAAISIALYFILKRESFYLASFSETNESAILSKEK
jgi:MFS family permease